MAALILLARLLISSVFLFAGVAKVLDRGASKKSLLEFGVPNRLASPSAIFLPIAEILVGLCLITARFAVYGLAGALVLLAVFTAAIAIALARGRKPDCHCFGQLQSKPIGWPLLARNSALAAVPAALLYYGPPQPSVSAWLAAWDIGAAGLLSISFGALCLLLLVAQSWLGFQLLKQSGRVLIRLDEMDKKLGGVAPHAAPDPHVPRPEGLPVGHRAPDFAAKDFQGRSVALAQLLSGAKPGILLFTHPGCGPCSALLPEVAQWQEQYASHFTLAVIAQGSRTEVAAHLKPSRLQNVLLQGDQDIANTYLAHGTPAAVLVTANGIIGSPLALGAEAIRSLISTAVSESVASLVSIGLQEGDVVPPLVFPNLDGEMFSLSELRGQASILLFWSPACGFCQQMLGDVKEWERRNSHATKLLVISSGTVEVNRQLGLRSPVVLDQNFSAGRMFGVGGTPSALLLDGDGRIASGIAVGRDQIVQSVFARQAVATAGS